jgi:hypothetical protein
MACRSHHDRVNAATNKPSNHPRDGRSLAGFVYLQPRIGDLFDHGREALQVKDIRWPQQ